VREHTEKIKPPRALFVPFPFGHAFGRPNDAVLQHRVLRAALELLAEASGPVLRDFPDEAAGAEEPPAPTQASAVKAGAGVPADTAAEVREIRSRHAEWILKNGGRTAFGLSGVTAERFDEVAVFLKTFGDGADGDFRGRRPEVALPSFIRWSADDAKALYYESYLVRKPDAGGDEIARWFWGQTAMGQILRRVKDRLDASNDPTWKAAAFGVAR
jgi:hypothetical protein